jgi:hypothetical protein
MPTSLVPNFGQDPWNNSGGVFSDPAGSIPDPDGFYGGGYDITGNNLLLGVWTITDTDPDNASVPNAGAQVRPVNTRGAEADNVFGIQGIGEFGLAQFCDSRTSARVVVQSDTGPGAEPPFLAVLNPPAELKSYAQDALKDVVYDASKPLKLAGSISKSLADVWMWAMEVTVPEAFGPPETVPQSFAVGGLTGQLFADIPLLKTSGANGQYPQFFRGFPLANAAQVNEALEAIRSGNYFIPLVFEWDPAVVSVASVTFSWAYSALRR